MHLHPLEENQKIYLFNGTNFPNWSYRMETLLEEGQLIECIRIEADKIEEFKPADSDTALVTAEMERRLAERKLRQVQCKSLLVEKIADSQLEYVKGKSTPKAIWEARAAERFRQERDFRPVLSSQAAGRDEIQ